MELINFNTIANINCSKKEIKEEEEKIFLYSDDSDKTPPKNQSKHQFREAFSKMNEKLQKLSINAINIINEKKFSYKILLEKYTNIQAFKKDEDFKKIQFNSSHDFNKIFNDNIDNNINLINLNNNNHNNINNIFKNSDSFKINSKNSNSSGKSQKFTEKKKKRGNSINENKDDTKKLFSDILNICQNISNLKNNVIEIKKDQNELFNENENIETTIICNDKEIVTIYLTENIVKKIHMIKNNKIFTEEKEISYNLKKIRRDLNKILNKLTKNK